MSPMALQLTSPVALDGPLGADHPGGVSTRIRHTRVRGVWPGRDTAAKEPARRAPNAYGRNALRRVTRLARGLL